MRDIARFVVSVPTYDDTERVRTALTSCIARVSDVRERFEGRAWTMTIDTPLSHDTRRHIKTVESASIISETRNRWLDDDWNKFLSSR